MWWRPFSTLLCSVFVLFLIQVNSLKWKKSNILTVVNGLATHFLAAGFSGLSLDISTLASSSSREPDSSSTIFTLDVFLPRQFTLFQWFGFGFRIFKDWIKGTPLNLLAPLPSALLGSLLSALLEWLSAHCHWFSTSQPHCWREAAGHNSWKKQQSAKYNSCQARSLHSAISPPICATLRVRFVAAFSEPHLWHSRGQEKEEEEKENRPGWPSGYCHPTTLEHVHSNSSSTNSSDQPTTPRQPPETRCPFPLMACTNLKAQR